MEAHGVVRLKLIQNIFVFLILKSEKLFVVEIPLYTIQDDLSVVRTLIVGYFY